MFACKILITLAAGQVCLQACASSSLTLATGLASASLGNRAGLLARTSLPRQQGMFAPWPLPWLTIGHVCFLISLWVNHQGMFASCTLSRIKIRIGSLPLSGEVNYQCLRLLAKLQGHNLGWLVVLYLEKYLGYLYFYWTFFMYFQKYKVKIHPCRFQILGKF